MAKEEVKKALTRGKASFMMIGKTKVTDKTFNLENEYDSGWTDNQMYLGVDCGNGNTVFAEMRGGYFPEQDNVIRVFSKDDKDANGKSKQMEIAWEDRLNEDLYDEIADTAFITVGIEKDVKGKTVYKKFLTAFDAVEYLSEHLEDDTIVNVKGTMGYSEYDDAVSVKKEITSIVLSKVEDEADFKATFTQTILLDKDSIGKTDKDKNTVELNAYVVDYVGKPKIDGKKVEVKKNVTYPKTFEVEINEENPTITAKMLDKFFKVKKKGVINELTVVGKLVEGGSVVNITMDDIPEDIKELIEMGLYTEDEAKAKLAVGGGRRERRMVITKPDITYVGKDEDKKATIAFEEGKYADTDLYFYAQAIEDATGVPFDADEEVSYDAAIDEEEDDLLALLNDM